MITVHDVGHMVLRQTTDSDGVRSFDFAEPPPTFILMDLCLLANSLAPWCSVDDLGFINIRTTKQTAVYKLAPVQLSEMAMTLQLVHMYDNAEGSSDAKQAEQIN